MVCDHRAGGITLADANTSLFDLNGEVFCIGEVTKVGIIICNRYQTCAGGKCFRSLQERAGAFSAYVGKDVVVAAYTTCGGCPGGNIESAPEEMKKNGVDVIHFGTCFLVGYPPCDRIPYFKEYIEKRYGIPVVIGSHPIPDKYRETHAKLGTWDSPEWQEHIKATITDEKKRLAYN